MITKGTQLVNMTNGNVVEVVEEEKGGKVTIATRTATGHFTAVRRVASTSIRSGLLTLMGKPWKTGYVPADQLPAGHPFALPVPAGTVAGMDEEIDFQAMDTEELAAFAASKLTQVAILAKLADGAKEEIRRRQPRKGTTVLGDTAVIAKYPETFSAELAKANLTDQQYKAICVSKPDATRAKKLLGGDGPLYRSLCKPGKASLEIRPATDKDRQASSDLDTAEEITAQVPFAPGDGEGSTLRAPF